MQIFKSLMVVAAVGWTAAAHADLDPFSVYGARAPAGCLEQGIGTEPLGLPELIQIGICNNSRLNKNYMSVKMAEASYGQARAEYLPAVSATGSLTQSYEKIEDIGSSKDHPYEGNIALSWLIYDFGGRTARSEQMKAYLDSAAFAYDASLSDTVLAINQAYFDLLGAQEVLKSTRASEASFKKSFEESSKRFELGLVSASDKLLAQTSYEESKLAVEQAKNAVQQGQGALAVLLNLSPDTSFNLRTPPKDKDITRLETDMSVSEMMELALTLRPEVKGSQSDLQSAAQGVRLARAEALPSLSAKASAGFGDDWRRTYPYQYGTAVGVSLSVPLFTGFSNTYKISRAKHAYSQASLAVIETQDGVRSEVWSSYQNYVTAAASYRISRQMLESAVENERVAFASYQVGKGSILNLLTAGSQLATARQEVIVAFYAVLTTKADLYRAIGRLK